MDVPRRLPTCASVGRGEDDVFGWRVGAAHGGLPAERRRVSWAAAHVVSCFSTHVPADVAPESTSAMLMWRYVD